jgi:DNA repair photolyase
VKLATSLTAEKARAIITRNDSPDISFNQSINPYRGCEHGCTYCYARPAHAYMGLSPGLDFESRLFFKPEGAALLERELSKPGYRPENIQIGGNTDPYQPVERKLQVTRAIIEVLGRFHHPFSIITKSALITRDLDLMGPMAEADLARAAVVDHHPRPQAGARDGAARRHARTPPGCGATAFGGGRADHRHVRAGDPGAERP